MIKILKIKVTVHLQGVMFSKKIFSRQINDFEFLFNSQKKLF